MSNLQFFSSFLAPFNWFTYATSRLLPENRPLRLPRPGPVIFLRAVVNEERGGSFLSLKQLIRGSTFDREGTLLRNYMLLVGRGFAVLAQKGKRCKSLWKPLARCGYTCT